MPLHRKPQVGTQSPSLQDNLHKPHSPATTSDMELGQINILYTYITIIKETRMKYITQDWLGSKKNDRKLS